ncbi:MAG TPA: amidase [Solirubrobacteraceae bacterium]|nr:amidase [Solirubrobacteraceae bacterium]
MRKPALELAELVRTEQLTPTELTETCLREIDRLEPQINAFTYVAHEEALAQAAAVTPGPERPFAGVPIAIKDNRAVAGMPITMGSDAWGDYRPDYDAHVVRRLRNAGFVIVGKTALPENGILPTCESRRNGPTANPWDPTRTPGGSSGGSGAAVAAGMVPVAHGNDGGGSTRIPAACCGLVGLKTQRNRVSSGPDSGQSYLTVDGVLTRTVADTAAITEIIAGYEPGDANWPPPPPVPYTEAVGQQPNALKIGLTLTPALASAELDPECARAVHEAARLLEQLGHSVEPLETTPWGDKDLLPDFTKAFGPATAMASIAAARLHGREEPRQDELEPLTWGMYERARNLNAIDQLTAQSRLERVAREIVTALMPYDVVLTPALAQRPLPTGAVHGRGPDPFGNYRRSGAFTPYTAIVNVTGLPAIALPLFHGDDGLPTAVQLIGRPAREDVLISLAAQLEAALPWAARRPPKT